MGRGIYWSYTPHENIAAAKARAKAALNRNEKNPRLTALERAFYNAFKKARCQLASPLRVLGTPVPQGSMKAYGSRVVANNAESLASWRSDVAAAAHRNKPEDWDIHAAVSLRCEFVFPRPLRITAQAETLAS